jgi:arylsulfatase A-like enzyme
MTRVPTGLRSLLLLLAAAIVLALAGAPARSTGRPAPARPDVLFIAVDDLNTCVGALAGHPGTLTPNIDRLSRRGILFTHAYCAAPACNPSRTALLTGRRPSTTGVYDNNQPWRPVLKDAVTLPEHFRANGYHVAGGGTIFHGGA